MDDDLSNIQVPASFSAAKKKKKGTKGKKVNKDPALGAGGK